MANQVIPVDRILGNYTQRVALDGTVFLLGLRWNDQMGKWILDLSTSDGSALLRGRPILEEVDLIGRFQGRVQGLPLGKLVAIDSTGKQRDPDMTTFGTEVQLCYIPGS